MSERGHESTDESLGVGISAEPLPYSLMQVVTVTHGHQPKHPFFLINSIDEAKLAHAILV